jgi:MraZ protein
MNILMGHASATVDDKGRLKIPTAFRRILEEGYGSDCFVTSVEGEKAVVYPLPVWLDILARLAKVPSTSVAKRKYLERVNYFGQQATIDGQGRILVPTILREVAGINGEVVVLGSQDNLEIWRGDRMQRRVAEDPLTAEDYKELELHGV